MSLLEPIGRRMTDTERMTRHRFSAKILRQVRELMPSNNCSGIVEVVEDWTVVVLSIIVTRCVLSLSLPSDTVDAVDAGPGSAYTPTTTTAIACLLLLVKGLCYAVCVLVIGGRQRALADILHQSSHECLASSPALNYVLGTFFSGYTVFQSLSIYAQSHVRMHHAWLGNPHKDPDYAGLILQSICGEHRSPTATRKYITSLLSPMNSIHYLRYLVKNRIFNPSEHRLESAVRLVYWSAITYALYAHSYFAVFFGFWIIPLITSNVWVGSLLELFEHFPMIDDAANFPFTDIYLSRNRVWPAVTNFFLGVHSEGYHLVHHLFPTLPSWNYERVHLILMQDESYAHLDHQKEGWIALNKKSRNAHTSYSIQAQNIFI